MTLVEIAEIYTNIVKVDDQIPVNEHIAKEEIAILRSKYHQMLMDKLREDGIQFSDRFEAMSIAFELVNRQPLDRIS